MLLWQQPFAAKPLRSPTKVSSTTTAARPPAPTIFNSSSLMRSAGGTQQGPALGFNDVQVTNGLFKATMDFGVAAFTGGNRWLEISLRLAASTGAYMTLNPRQNRICHHTRSKSLNATSADGLSAACVNCVTSTQIGSLPGGSPSYIQNATTTQAASNFNISGNGTAGGTLSGNAVNATTQYNLGGSRLIGTGTTTG